MEFPSLGIRRAKYIVFLITTGMYTLYRVLSSLKVECTNTHDDANFCYLHRKFFPTCAVCNKLIAPTKVSFAQLLPKQVDCFFGDTQNSRCWQESRMFWVTWQNAQEHIPLCCVDQFFLRASSQSSIFGFCC